MHSVQVAGAEREVWLMSNAQTRERWAIFEIDGTPIVMAYTSDQVDEAIIPYFNLLEPLP